MYVAGLLLGLKLMATLAGPAVVALLQLVQVALLKKRNGSAILRQRRIERVAIFMSGAMFAVFLALVLSSDSLRRVLLYVAVSWIVSGGYLSASLEGFFRGVYVQGIVYPGYSCRWEDIELILHSHRTVRFVHKENGAFDMAVPDGDAQQVLDQIRAKTLYSGRTEKGGRIGGQPSIARARPERGRLLGIRESMGTRRCTHRRHRTDCREAAVETAWSCRLRPVLVRSARP